MRAGTQTLIQALQALPWTDPDNEDDVMPHSLNPIDSDSDEEGKPGLYRLIPVFGDTHSPRVQPIVSHPPSTPYIAR
jgi:hypothetical protein